MAIAQARPEQMITVTLTGTSWVECHTRMASLNRTLGRKLGDRRWQCCYHVHTNPNRDGQTHIHAFVRGPEVAMDTLQDAALKAGMGRVVNVIHLDHWAYGYGLHPILDTAELDAPEATDQITAYLQANGNRQVHATRDFWLTPDGHRCDLKTARKSTTNHTWVIQSMPLEHHQTAPQAPRTDRDSQPGAQHPNAVSHP